MAGVPAVALVAVGDPESPQTWSGTVAGVLHALRALGVQTHAVDLTLPAGAEQAMLAAGALATRNRFDAQSAALTMRVRTILARLHLRGVRLDGAIQVGTNVLLPAGLPFVTLEDMTLRQGRSVHPVFSRMSQAGIAAWERRRRGIYARARVCAAASHWAAESLLDDYGLAPERVAVVGLGPNHTIDDGRRARDWQTPRFLFVGIDWERKGGPLLVRAFSRLRQERPDATLDVVGGHPPLREPGVNAHGVLSFAHAGDRELLSELFARATCFVMPSQVEPFGIVHIEAATAGLPSIGTSVGGPRDVIGTDAGVVVAPGDEQALVHAMRRLSDPACAREMGAAARRRARLYTWPQTAERLLRALNVQLPDGRALVAPL
ncbi:MAG TPA: glycosyltransferase family 4 protein [Solirubrobacteraceae bacterium]|nr:glycosyltransferase family 4 protein [Solirubrobacteraceae bacterium]